MRILLVAEGDHELGSPSGDSALEILCRRMLACEAEFSRKKVSSSEVRVHMQPGSADGYQRRALAWLRYAEREGFGALVLVIDQDNDLGRAAQFHLVQEDGTFSLPRALGVAIRTFDAWMLADEKALTKVLCRNVQTQRDPETLSDPKSVCRRLRDESPIDLGLQELYASIAHIVDLTVLKRRCPRGFQTFALRVRAISPAST